MSSPARKIAGALSAGCAIILKASEETPAGAVQLARAFHDAGLPPGVLNLVFGTPGEISEYLIPQPSVRLVTFTGSIPVGKKLAAMAGEHMKPAIMELGGHAPAIVCEDADPVTSAATSVMDKPRNAGQVCVSPTRFFVHEAIYRDFTNAFAEKARAVKVGDGFDPANQMGPLANHRRIETMEAMVVDATAKGARLLAGGSRIGNRGYYYPLTGAGRSARRRPRDARGALRPARADQSSGVARRGDPEGERPALRACRVRLHALRPERRPPRRRRRGGQPLD
jgi:succinate-semialdehyde dehydrogenase/glutarate-semialdehyde dehydrogenase